MKRTQPTTSKDSYTSIFIIQSILSDEDASELDDFKKIICACNTLGEATKMVHEERKRAMLIAINNMFVTMDQHESPEAPDDETAAYLRLYVFASKYLTWAEAEKEEWDDEISEEEYAADGTIRQYKDSGDSDADDSEEEYKTKKKSCGGDSNPKKFYGYTFKKEILERLDVDAHFMNVVENSCFRISLDDGESLKKIFTIYHTKLYN